jgi:hypothetical protein
MGGDVTVTSEPIRCSQCAYRAAQSRVDGYDLNFSDDLLALDRELAD